MGWLLFIKKCLVLYTKKDSWAPVIANSFSYVTVNPLNTEPASLFPHLAMWPANLSIVYREESFPLEHPSKVWDQTFLRFMFFVFIFLYAPVFNLLCFLFLNLMIVRSQCCVSNHFAHFFHCNAEKYSDKWDADCGFTTETVLTCGSYLSSEHSLLWLLVQ